MTAHPDEVPAGSIYIWMYRQGLRKVPLIEVIDAVRAAGKEIREKDETNYWNGWYNSSLADDGHIQRTGMFEQTPNRSVVAGTREFFKLKLCQYPPNMFADMPDIGTRFVPCNAMNKPMCKWAYERYTKEDAELFPNQVYLAENLKGGKYIVIDVDGDHDEKLDGQTISFFHRFRTMTHTMSKPKMIREYPGYEKTNLCSPASYHLTFKTDRLIPIMHFPMAHVDIIGNRTNALRYFKDKVWNGLEPMKMDDETWETIKYYLKRREYPDGE